MDFQQAKDHLRIVKLRVNSLEHELRVAFDNSKTLDDRIKLIQDSFESIVANKQVRNKELETRFESEKSECNRQIKLAEDVLAKKREERQALMGYLDGLDIKEISFNDLRDFDWESLYKLAENIHGSDQTVLRLQAQSDSLNLAIQAARQQMAELTEILASTRFAKDRLTNTLDESRNHFDEYNKIRTLQEKRINKLQIENERLNLLIRQCVSHNEPMSDYVTKNIQAKCHSFVNSDDSQELLDGLMKFRSRQERLIKLLQYKDNKLGSETNKLQVAKDQTHDQVKFYLSMLAASRNKNSDRTDVSGEPERQRMQHHQRHHQQQHVTFLDNILSSHSNQPAA